MSGPVSRGFRHLRRPPAGHEGRVPPGQYVTQGFPVLSAGPTPHTPLPEWTFSIRHGGDTLKSWTWPQFQALPVQAVTADIHCVTPLVQANSGLGGVRLRRPAARIRARFVGGPTRFAETVAEELVALRLPPGRVKTERFGAT